MEDHKVQKLAHLYSEIELNMLEGLMKNNEIPILVKREGTGSYLKIYSGFNYQGMEVYVADEHYKKALEVMEIFNQTQTLEEEETLSIDSSSNDRMRRRMIFFIISIPLIIAVITVILLVLE